MLTTVLAAGAGGSESRAVGSGHGWPGSGSAASGSSGLEAYDGPDLLSAVTHELRTPVTALAAASELLAEDLEVLDPHQRRAMVTAIHRGALWLQALVENLLCATTIREGRFRIQSRPIDLLEVVHEIRPVVEPLLARRGQRLRIAARGGLGAVSADGRRVGQVLVNLIANAAKFGAPNAPVDLTLAPRRGAVRVMVADRGPGLPAGGAERLFEPFERGEAARCGPEGLGLGLAIVASIVRAHGGRVGAEDRPRGGAQFWFELPTSAVVRTPHAEPGPGEEGAR